MDFRHYFLTFCHRSTNLLGRQNSLLNPLAHSNLGSEYSSSDELVSSEAAEDGDSVHELSDVEDFDKEKKPVVLRTTATSSDEASNSESETESEKWRNLTDEEMLALPCKHEAIWLEIMTQVTFT